MATCLLPRAVFPRTYVCILLPRMHVLASKDQTPGRSAQAVDQLTFDVTENGERFFFRF